MKIEIHPLKWLYYNLNKDVKSVAVIMSSYEVRENKLDGLQAKLILSFNDITDRKNPSAFNEDLARQICDFISDIPEDAEVLYVCCDSGESRSSAVTAAILRYSGADDMKIWKNPAFHPNPLVYELMCQAFGIVLTDGEVQKKVEINNNALSEKIVNARKN